MIPLVKLREDLKFSREVQEMIEVLKGATSSQFRVFQTKKEDTGLYRAWQEDFMTMIDPVGIDHPFLKERLDLPKIVVMITSDDGFLGNLNSLIINAAIEQSSKDDDIIVLGERGARYLTETRSSAFTVLPGVGDDITYRRAVAVRDLLLQRFTQKNYGTILVSYARFLSFTVQKTEVVRLLPCPGIFSQKSSSKRRAARGEILTEPSKARVLDYLVRSWLMQKLYDMFWESKLSECAARIIHLEGSEEEIREVNKHLTYEYFKHLHGISDKNIREIFASRLRSGTS